MQKAVCMALLGFFVTACIPLDSSPDIVEPIEEHPSSVAPPQAEQVPSELSLKHFAAMPLEGTGFTLEDIEYRTDAYSRYAIGFLSNGLSVTGILNIPHGEGPFPLLALNHGYINPKVYTRGRGLKREQDYFARHGFAVLHTDYRGHADSDPSPDTRNIYDAGLEYSMDVVNGIRALRSAKIPGIDTEHVGMLGHSMGGGVTQNILVAYPDLVDAAVLYASVHGDAWENFNRWRKERDDDDRTETLGTPEDNPDAWEALSASSLYDRITAPILVFHGGKDTDVPSAWSETLVSRLKDVKKDVTFVQYPMEKHEFIIQWDDFMRRSAAFFKEHLREEEVWKLPLEQNRIVLKPFATYVSPESSPVKPERFLGYHTGADFELMAGERPHNVAVKAACTGPVLLKKTVSGYGGLVLQQCTFGGEAVTVLYGHLWLASVKVDVGDLLAAGEDFSMLGDANSAETDGERAHLHFSVHKGQAPELRGYVQKTSELDKWIDPAAAISPPK